MIRKKIKIDEERKLIINLIVSTRFCKEIIPLLRPEYLKTAYAREVSSWIIEYYEQFKEAPNRDIKNIYHTKRATLKEEDTDNISTFLKSISDEYENSFPNNVEYEISETITYLKLQAAEVLKESLVDSLLSKNALAAELAIANFKRVEKPLGEGVSLLHDAAEIIDAFFEDEEPLFTFPGALGEIAGKFHRGDFMAYFAPMKRGKTWWLLYTAETALHSQLKVIFFTLEMTRKQIIRRAWRSLIGKPKNTSVIKMPSFLKDDDADKYRIIIKSKQREGIDPSTVEEYQKKFRRKFRKGDIRIISLPSKSATVSDLNAHLDNLQYYENFIPDVIVIDYADILLADKNVREYRHGLDSIWAGLRRMAQERNALVATASQTEKGTFKHDVAEGSAAEDIRKIAHVTCGLGLNQTKFEAQSGVIRVSQIVTREERKAFQQAVVLQCLDIGRTCLDSHLTSQVIKSQESDDDDDSEKPHYKRKNDDD